MRRIPEDDLAAKAYAIFYNPTEEPQTQEELIQEYHRDLPESSRINWRNVVKFLTTQAPLQVPPA